eukprot:gene5159-10308_t
MEESEKISCYSNSVNGGKEDYIAFMMRSSQTRNRIKDDADSRNRSLFALSEAGANSTLVDNVQFHLDGLFSTSLHSKQRSALELLRICIRSTNNIVFHSHGITKDLMRICGLIASEGDKTVLLCLKGLTLALCTDGDGNMSSEVDVPVNVLKALLSSDLALLRPKYMPTTSSSDDLVTAVSTASYSSPISVRKTAGFTSKRKFRSKIGMGVDQGQRQRQGDDDPHSLPDGDKRHKMDSTDSTTSRSLLKGSPDRDRDSGCVASDPYACPSPTPSDSDSSEGRQGVPRVPVRDSSTTCCLMSAMELIRGAWPRLCGQLWEMVVEGEREGEGEEGCAQERCVSECLGLGLGLALSNRIMQAIAHRNFLCARVPGQGQRRPGISHLHTHRLLVYQMMMLSAPRQRQRNSESIIQSQSQSQSLETSRSPVKDERSTSGSGSCLLFELCQLTIVMLECCGKYLRVDDNKSKGHSSTLSSSSSRTRTRTTSSITTTTSTRYALIPHTLKSHLWLCLGLLESLCFESQDIQKFIFDFTNHTHMSASVDTDIALGTRTGTETEMVVSFVDTLVDCLCLTTPCLLAELDDVVSENLHGIDNGNSNVTVTAQMSVTVSVSSGHRGEEQSQSNSTDEQQSQSQSQRGNLFPDINPQAAGSRRGFVGASDLWGAVARLLVDIMAGGVGSVWTVRSICESCCSVLREVLGHRSALAKAGRGRGSDLGALGPHECMVDRLAFDLSLLSLTLLSNCFRSDFMRVWDNDVHRTEESDESSLTTLPALLWRLLLEESDGFLVDLREGATGNVSDTGDVTVTGTGNCTSQEVRPPTSELLLCAHGVLLLHALAGGVRRSPPKGLWGVLTLSREDPWPLTLPPHFAALSNTTTTNNNNNNNVLTTAYKKQSGNVNVTSLASLSSSWWLPLRLLTAFVALQAETGLLLVDDLQRIVDVAAHLESLDTTSNHSRDPDPANGFSVSESLPSLALSMRRGGDTPGDLMVRPLLTGRIGSGLGYVRSTSSPDRGASSGRRADIEPVPVSQSFSFSLSPRTVLPLAEPSVATSAPPASTSSSTSVSVSASSNSVSSVRSEWTSCRRYSKKKQHSAATSPFPHHPQLPVEL